MSRSRRTLLLQSEAGTASEGQRLSRACATWNSQTQSRAAFRVEQQSSCRSSPETVNSVKDPFDAQICCKLLANYETKLRVKRSHLCNVRNFCLEPGASVSSMMQLKHALTRFVAICSNFWPDKDDCMAAKHTSSMRRLWVQMLAKYSCQVRGVSLHRIPR